MKRPRDHDLESFHAHLKYLNLPFIREHYADFTKKAAAADADHLALMMRLVEGEAQLRKDRSVERRIRLARFPVRKTLDQSTGAGRARSIACRCKTSSACSSSKTPPTS